MCKRLFLLMTLCVLVGLGTKAFAAGYPDVAGGIYETAFSGLTDIKAVQGYADGLGRPNGLLNRAEALKVILASQAEREGRIAWMRGHMPPISLYADVDQKAWYGPYLEVAFENGIVTGYPDGTFRPGQLLRVEEAVAFLLRSYGEKGEEGTAQLSEFIQNREGEWFTPYINAAINRNLVMHRGTLRLNTAITRGQFFDMVYRMHEVQKSDLFAYDGPEPQEMQQVRAQPQPIQNGAVDANGSGTAIRAVQEDTPRITSTQRPETQPVRPVIVAGATPGASEKSFSISMPSLDIDDLTVTHPEDPFSNDGILKPLEFGVGHLFSYPGGGGKIMVYGHSSGYPWDLSSYTKIFRKVNELQPGDKVYVTYNGNLYTYEVTHEETVPAGDTTRFQDNGSGEELILYTCWPPDSISQRYLVFAKPVQTVASR